jgi:hypothetical protein
MNNLLKHIIRFWVFAFVCLQILYGQNEDRNWVFNINQGLKFLPDGNVSFFTSKLNDSLWTTFPSSCISNKNGDLLFYSGTHDSIPQPSTSYNFLFDSNHQYVKNSFNLSSWYGQSLILPADTIERFYHYFHQMLYGAPEGRPLFYSEIDAWENAGLGEITSKKNIRIFSEPTVSNYSAVRHANGRDWWIIAHEYGTNRFLILNSVLGGQHLKKYQSIGEIFGKYDNGGWGGGGGSLGHFRFNNRGDKLLSLCFDGTIDCFNFDRCSGLLSNHKNIRQGSTLGTGDIIIYDACLSPNGRFLYTSGVNTISSNRCYIDQYDLNADDILASRVILYTSPHLNVELYGISLAPNDKIYFTKKNSAPTPNSFPSQDYLGVIHLPDNKGALCNLDLYGLYLNGGKSSLSLPHIPNLQLGPVDGSICDSLGIDAVNTLEETFPENKSIYIYPNPSGLSASQLVINGNQSNYQIFIYESSGKLVWNINSEHNSIQLPSNLSPGVYHIEVSGIGGINWIVN